MKYLSCAIFHVCHEDFVYSYSIVPEYREIESANPQREQSLCSFSLKSFVFCITMVDDDLRGRWTRSTRCGRTRIEVNNVCDCCFALSQQDFHPLAQALI
jgi:hypothetical protein